MWPFKKKEPTFEEKILQKCKNVKKWERKDECGNSIIYSSLEIPFQIRICSSIVEISFEGNKLRASFKFGVDFLWAMEKRREEDKLNRRLLLESKILNSINSSPKYKVG